MIDNRRFAVWLFAAGLAVMILSYVPMFAWYLHSPQGAKIPHEQLWRQLFLIGAMAAWTGGFCKWQWRYRRPSAVFQDVGIWFAVLEVCYVLLVSVAPGPASEVIYVGPLLWSVYIVFRDMYRQRHMPRFER